MTTLTNEAFAKVWSLGYHTPIPIVPPGAVISEKSSLYRRRRYIGKVPGYQGADGLWRSFDWIKHRTTEKDLLHWQAMRANVGLRAGPQEDGTYLGFIDADTMDPEHAARVEAGIARRFGRLPKRVGLAPKALYVVRLSGPVPYQRIDVGDDGSRVEFLGEGRQAVVSGDHPKTGKPYHWPVPLPAYKDLPVFGPESIPGFLEDLRPLLPASRIIQEGAKDAPPQESLVGELESVRMAVRAIPNTSEHFATRESYRDMGYAIKAALPGYPDEAFDLFLEWCERWEDPKTYEDGTVGNSVETVEADWRRMKPPFRIGAPWLYEKAQKFRPGFLSERILLENPGIELHVGAEVETEEVEADGDQDAAPEPTPKPKPKYEFLKPRDALATCLSGRKPQLIEGLLSRGAFSVIYGESNAGKTFVALDMAYHVALGRPYDGMEIDAGIVVYIAAEGGDATRDRVAALCMKYGDTDNFNLLMKPVDLLSDGADLGPLTAEIMMKFPGCALIVIDTLSRSLAGGDENSSVDMGKLVKHFDLMRDKTKAHLMVVHHSGKDRAKGARGHSLLRAALDTELEVADGEITIQKQRDLPKDWSSPFELKIVELGFDERAKKVTTCTVNLVKDKKVTVGVPSKNEADVLAAIKLAVATTPTPEGGVSAAEVGEFCAKTADDIRPVLKSLLIKRLVTNVARGRWLPAPTPQKPEPEAAENHVAVQQKPEPEAAEKPAECPTDLFS
jgi:hypothetical protein